MSKAVLLSIKPQYCELIANGKKTVEVRKTRPKLEIPFKCYIYCTKDKHGWFDFLKKERLDGKVIGEFVCDKIDEWNENESPPIPLEETCLSYSEIRRYGEDAEKLYLWHISDLVIYDKPKELSEFRKYISFLDGESIEELEAAGINNIRLKKAPQSWCYVEEIA